MFKYNLQKTTKKINFYYLFDSWKTITSYGDWGRVYSFLMDKTSADIFKQMVDEGVVELWRAQFYLIRRSFCYEDGKGWTTFDETEKKRVSCDEPAIVTEYKNKKQNEKQIYFNELTY